MMDRCIVSVNRCKSESVNIFENIPKKQTENFAITLRDDGLYNILSRIALLDEDLPETTIVKCLLGISKASYKVSRKTVYYTG
ncbi:hypothetical protein P5V15_010211 [Pogonomyrmex californicus]